MKRSRQRLMKKIQRKTSPQRELVTGTRKWQYTFFAHVMKSGKLESDMITGELDGYKGGEDQEGLRWIAQILVQWNICIIPSDKRMWTDIIIDTLWHKKKNSLKLSFTSSFQEFSQTMHNFGTYLNWLIHSKSLGLLTSSVTIFAMTSRACTSITMRADKVMRPILEMSCLTRPRRSSSCVRSTQNVCHILL